MFFGLDSYIAAKGDGSAMKQSDIWRPQKGRGGPGGNGLLIGLLTALGIILLSVTLSALLIAKETVKLEESGIMAKASYCAAVLLGSLLTARKAKQAKLLWSSLTAALVAGLTLGMVFAMPNVKANGVGTMLALTAGGWLIGSFFGVRKKKDGYV